MRLGILGGTFDPVHNGHLHMAESARREARLGRVLMIPCHRPPHKDRTDLAGSFHRFAMLALSIQDREGLEASDLELRRGSISYTADTLRQLRSERPGDEIFLILGSDSFVELETWRDFRQILETAALLVVPRPGFEGAEIEARAPASLREILRPAGAARPAQGGLPRATVLRSRPVEISSTEIRTRARDGRPISGMVPAPVEAYIRRQGLYGSTVHA